MGTGTGPSGQGVASVGGGGTQPSRRLAAIMFTDLVGYSALAHRDEALAIELLELHRAWVREILPRHGGTEIETVGDAFLIEFSGALAALRCAVEIQQRFAQHNAEAPEGRRMQLRIGIHLGDVEHKDGKVMGDGVNIASRIHGMAEPGGICVSEDVHHAVRNRAGFAFRSLGTPQLKNIETALELYRVTSEGAPVAATPAGGRPSRRAVAVAAAAAAAVAIGVGTAVWLAQPARRDAPPSVAVLPFDNLSAEPDSAFFTDGLHDTVIGHLARVRDLKVISRTSVMGYRNQKGSLRKIAAELGVKHIVEGSVQRAGGRLRVAAQLIETGSDTHLWSQEYDRDLADVFAVQADIAKQVAAAVQAQLTPQERARIERIPTRNPQAYDLYLRALVISRGYTVVRHWEAVGLLDQAVALDPEFALGHALLAQLHDQIFWMASDQGAAHRELSARHAEIALRLDPALAEGHVAKAWHLYHGFRDYEGALRSLETARGIAPGNGQIPFLQGAIYRRQARWEEALRNFEEAVTVDPLNELFLGEYAGTLLLLRHYATADAIYGRIEQLAADPRFVRMMRGGNRVNWKGDLAPLEQALAGIPPDVDPGCMVSLARWDLRLLQDRHEEAVAAVLACPGDSVAGAGESTPKGFFVAMAHLAAGDLERARASARAVRPLLERLVAEHAGRALNRVALAAVLGILGETEAGRQQLDQALEAMPLSRDAVTGAFLRGVAARIWVLLGQPERALALLEESLKLPGGTHARYEDAHPAWDPLRDDPRFRKLIADHLPKA